jgi:hypothetical protein
MNGEPVADLPNNELTARPMHVTAGFEDKTVILPRSAHTTRLTLCPEFSSQVPKVRPESLAHDETTCGLHACRWAIGTHSRIFFRPIRTIQARISPPATIASEVQARELLDQPA